MSHLVSCGKSVLIHDVSMDPILKVSPHSSSVNCCIWNHNNCVIASCGNDGVIVLSHATNGQLLLPLTHNGKAINAISFASNSQYLASGGQDSIVHIWDLKKKQIQCHLKGHYSQINSLHWNATDSLVASASNVGDILVHEVNTQINVATFKLAESKTPGFKAVRFMSKSFLCSGSNNGSVTIFDLNRNDYLCNFSQQHDGKVTALSVAQSLLCSVGTDQKCHLYSVVDKKVTHSIQCENPLSSVALHTDSYSVCVGTLYGQMYVYDMRMTTKPKQQFGGHENTSVNYMEYSNVDLTQQPQSSRILSDSSASSQSKPQKPSTSIPKVIEPPKPQIEIQSQSRVSSKFEQSTSKIEDISKKYEHTVSRVINSDNSGGFNEEQKKQLNQLITEQTYQVKKIVQDSISGMHIDMIRQFQIQQNEMKALLEQYQSQQNSLIQRITTLEQENQQLKRQSY